MPLTVWSGLAGFTKTTVLLKTKLNLDGLHGLVPSQVVWRLDTGFSWLATEGHIMNVVLAQFIVPKLPRKISLPSRKCLAQLAFSSYRDCFQMQETQVKHVRRLGVFSFVAVVSFPEGSAFWPRSASPRSACPTDLRVWPRCCSPTPASSNRISPPHLDGFKRTTASGTTWDIHTTVILHEETWPQL